MDEENNEIKVVSDTEFVLSESQKDIIKEGIEKVETLNDFISVFVTADSFVRAQGSPSEEYEVLFRSTQNAINMMSDTLNFPEDIKVMSPIVFMMLFSAYLTFIHVYSSEEQESLGQALLEATGVIKKNTPKA